MPGPDAAATVTAPADLHGSGLKREISSSGTCVDKSIRYGAVFISPHLDDAVFSCAGEIDRLARQGPVLVLNIFTRFLGELKHRAVSLGPERYNEERAAAKFLGYTSDNLDELDASFRCKAYRSIGNIFGPPVPEDLRDLAALRERIFSYLAELSYDRLYIPLAIGWHVDHLLTYLVFEPWATRENVHYYEDAPYSLIPNTTRYRLNEIGVYAHDPGDQTLAPESNLRAWWQTSRGYAKTALMRNLQPRIVRHLAVPVVSAFLYKLMSRHYRSTGSSKSKYELNSRLLHLEHHFSRKVAAMELYGSQFKEFFCGTDDCASQYRSYSTQVDGRGIPSERYWKMGSRTGSDSGVAPSHPSKG